MKLRYLLPAIIFFGLVALFAVGLKLNPRELPSPLIDRPAPAFSLPSLREPEQQLSEALFRQQPVALFNVWASWCTSCREEHAFLMELSRRGDLAIYGLNFKDERPEAVAWLSRYGNPYKVTVADREGRVGIDWGVYGVPETFVVDGQGVVRHRHAGPLSQRVWEQELKPLIERIRSEGRK